MTIAQREFILTELHAEAEREFRLRGWRDGQHEVWLHTFVTEMLVSRVITAENRVGALEDKIKRLEAEAA